MIDVIDFKGDVIIIPCDSELTYHKVGIVAKILDKGGEDLLKELTSIGYCEVGYAVIVQGYELPAKNIIFMPVSDHNHQETRINYIDLHQSLKAAFTLADLYKAKTVAIAGIHIPNTKRSVAQSLWKKFTEGKKEAGSPSSDEIEDIIISTSKNFKDSSIKELIIYKYSK